MSDGEGVAQTENLTIRYLILIALTAATVLAQSLYSEDALSSIDLHACSDESSGIYLVARYTEVGAARSRLHQLLRKTLHPPH